MLVFFSDVHLTDGTSGETINAGAFDLFADQVAELAQKRLAREVRLVLLGDGLDVIRSTRWLDDPHGPRPWSEAGPEQENLALEILRAILDTNRQALEFLSELPGRVGSRTEGKVMADQVRLNYVLGNHDWLINRYPSTRALVAERLNLPPRYAEEGFPLDFASPPEVYNVVARHGDVYDSLNYDASAGRNASSLGDAIVVELVNRFPLEVARELAGHAACDDAVRRLREIDNVRPLSLIPAWVVETIAGLEKDEPGTARAVQRAVRRCVDEFRSADAYRQFARRQLGPAERAFLGLILNGLRRQKAGALELWTRRAMPILKAAAPVAKHCPWVAKHLPREYAEHALGERHADGQLPRFVVYGHTHRVETVPLEPQSRDDGGRFYVNSGTWRAVWEQGQTSDASRHFDSWKVMSYLAIYSAEEGRGKHEFEIWTGSLRDRRGMAPQD